MIRNGSIFYLLFFALFTFSCSLDTKSSADLDLTEKDAGQAVSAAVSGDWPQWLGPDRNGVSAETGLRKNWETNPPEVVWRLKLGDGFSAFVIAAGKAYTMYSDNEDEYAVCLDAANGEKIWEVKTGKAFSDWQGGDGPRATPTIDGSIAYFYGASGNLYALNAESGARIWNIDVKEAFSGEVPQWGYSCSPLVEGDMLIIEAGGKPNSALVALNKKTGAVLWRSQEDKAGYSSPIALTVDSLRQLIFFTATHIMSLSPENGDLHWKFTWETNYDINAATPLFIPPNRVFFSSENDTGGALYEISVTNNRASAKQLWHNIKMKNSMATSVYYKGHIYGLNKKILKCLDAETGEEKWKTRGFGLGSLILADGHLLVLSDKGVLGLVEATPEAYRLVSEAKVLKGISWTVPSLAGGYLYLRNHSEAICLNLQDQKQAFEISELK